MPVLHLLVGPNGAGKSTLYTRVLAGEMHLPCVNADVVAAERWPGDESDHAYEAAALAAEQRAANIAAGVSFVAETVFSHPSKLAVSDAAHAANYRVTLHVVLIPEALAVARVAQRVAHGGHTVPVDKIRARFQRLWPLVATAIAACDEARIYDNSSVASVRTFAVFRGGHPVGAPQWPSWTPRSLTHPAPAE